MQLHASPDPRITILRMTWDKECKGDGGLPSVVLDHPLSWILNVGLRNNPGGVDVVRILSNGINRFLQCAWTWEFCNSGVVLRVLDMLGFQPTQGVERLWLITKCAYKVGPMQLSSVEKMD